MIPRDQEGLGTEVSSLGFRVVCSDDQCRAELSEEMTVCPKCGKKINWGDGEFVRKGLIRAKEQRGIKIKSK